MPPVRRDRWHPMRYDDRRSVDAVHVSEEASGGLGHHHDDRAPLGDAPERVAHPWLGLGQHRVEGRDHRFGDLLEQGDAVVVIRPVPVDTVQTELVLDVDHVDA